MQTTNQKEDTMIEHTPGEWAVAKHGPWVTSGNGAKVIVIGANTKSRCDFAAEVASLEDLANRRLIAAAPKLLEACQLAKKQLWTFHDLHLNPKDGFTPRDHKAMDLLVQTINEATGEPVF